MGTSFGIAYKLGGPIPDDSIQSKIKWQSPEPGMTNPATGQNRKSTEQIVGCTVGRECKYFYTFDEGWEIVEGTWRLGISYDNRILLSESFEVRGQ